MNMPKSRDIQVQIPLSQAIWNLDLVTGNGVNSNVKSEHSVKYAAGKLQNRGCCAIISECKAIKEMIFAYEEKTDDAGTLFCAYGADYRISGYP